MKNSKGFTLTEVIIVLGIIGILSAVSLPGILGWLPKHRLNSSANELYAAIQQAKLKAIKGNANIVVNLDFAAESYTVTDNGETIKRGKWTNGVNLAGATFTPPLTFNSRGIPNTSGSITLTNEDLSRQLEITSGGSIRMN